MEYKAFADELTLCKHTYLVATKVVDNHHADEVKEHTEPLKGDHGKAEGSVLLSQTRCVIPAELTAFLAGQTPSGQFPGFIRVCSLV